MECAFRFACKYSQRQTNYSKVATMRCLAFVARRALSTSAFQVGCVVAHLARRALSTSAFQCGCVVASCSLIAAIFPIFTFRVLGFKAILIYRHPIHYTRCSNFNITFHILTILARITSNVRNSRDSIAGRTSKTFLAKALWNVYFASRAIILNPNRRFREALSNLAAPSRIMFTYCSNLSLFHI